MPASASLLITDRDIEILAMVHAYGGLGMQHIQQRFFPTLGARSACYARIARLVAAAYLQAHRLPATAGVGSGPLFLTVGSQAKPVLAKLLRCPQSELQRATRMQVPLQLAHHLATSAFRLALELAVEMSALATALEWTPEWELRRAPLRLSDPQAARVHTLVPDGAFTLSLADGSEQSFFVEIDMATMTEYRRLRARLRGYFIAARANPLPVLFVTTTPARAATLARLAGEEAAKLKADATIFWLALQDAVTRDSVLTAPIWQVVNGPERHTLLAAAEDIDAVIPVPPIFPTEGSARDHALAQPR